MEVTESACEGAMIADRGNQLNVRYLLHVTAN